MSNSDMTKKPKKSNKRKIILVTGCIFLSIIATLVFSLFYPESQPDPASEKLIRDSAASQLNKYPEDFVDEDFKKVTNLLIGSLLQSSNPKRTITKIADHYCPVNF